MSGSFDNLPRLQSLDEGEYGKISAGLRPPHSIFTMSDMPIAVDRVAPGPARIGIPCVDHRRQDGSGPAQLIKFIEGSDRF
jgi:hypothetical protein